MIKLEYRTKGVWGDGDKWTEWQPTQSPLPEALAWFERFPGTAKLSSTDKGGTMLQYRPAQ